MCDCKRGLRGPQGEQGPIGPQGTLTISQVIIGSTSISGSTTVTLIASIATSGNMSFFGQLNFSSTGAVQATVSTLLNGSPLSGKDLVVTGAAAISGASYIVLPVSDYIAVTAGQALAFTITLDNYTRSTSLTGRIQYNIV